MKTPYLATAALIPVVGILWVWQPFHRAKKSERAPAPVAAQAADERDDQALRVAARPLAPARVVARPPASAAPSAKADSSKPTPPSSRERFEYIGTSFEMQTIDRAWAPATEQKIRSKVSDLLPSGASLRSAECRESICRLEVAFGSEEDLRKFNEKAFRAHEGRVWDGRAAGGPLNQDDPTQPGMIAYLFRDGSPVPEL